MSNNWNNYLSTYGASFNSDREVNFAQEGELIKMQGDLLMTDLSYLGLIEVSGDDKKTFLQGQLTNDINAISSSLSHLSGLCTPKGRLRTIFSIFSRDESLFLQLPHSLLEETFKRLKMFIMMSKVELSDASESIVKIGITGNKASFYLKVNGFNLPNEINMVTENNGLQIIRLPGKIPRFECIGSIDDIQNLWTALQPNAQLINTHHWRLLDIRAGIPNVFLTSKEAFIPQMLNLQVLNGINFKKGCYTGQEVVARMQYLGKLKRRMYQAHCQTNKLPLPGDILYSASSRSGQGAGHIVDAQKSTEDSIELLAVITLEAIENKDIFLDEAMQIPLFIKELPYSLEAD